MGGGRVGTKPVLVCTDELLFFFVGGGGGGDGVKQSPGNNCVYLNR